MRGASVFWGIVLILFGALLLLGNLGLLPIDAWQVMWPLLLILLGVWALLGSLRKRGGAAVSLAVPLSGAARARVRLHHGAGRLHVTGGAGPTELLAGSFGGGVRDTVSASGDERTADLKLDMAAPDRWGPWAWGRGGLDWSIRLNQEVPVALELETGASDTRVDLTSVKATEVKLSTGASNTELTLPAAAGHTKVVVKAGAASVKIAVPAGVAAKVRATTGLATVDVDTARFPKTDGGWASADFDTAASKAQIDIDAGVGSVSVR